MSFNIPKGSPTPHEMPDGTGIDFLAPFHSTLSVIPPNGKCWHYVTESNSVRFTWQNFLVGRDTNNAISFQAELFNNGDYTFRYAFPLHFLSFTNDFVIGAQFGGDGETFAMNNYSNLANGVDIIWDLPDSQIDTDGDGTYDIVELYYGFDPNDGFTPLDWDNDGLSNNFEYQTSLDYISQTNAAANGKYYVERLNARLFDSDGDKLPDIFEVMYTNFNPFVAHSTADEYLNADPDGNGLNNAEEMIYGTNPFLPDTDGDSTNDYQEVFVSMTNPLSSDNVYPDDIIESILELSGTDTNDYMLLVMGSSTNILLTSSSYYPISKSIKICSTNQLLDVKLSRNLEVNSNEQPELTEVTSRVYTMDPSGRALRSVKIMGVVLKRKVSNQHRVRGSLMKGRTDDIHGVSETTYEYDSLNRCTGETHLTPGNAELELGDGHASDKQFLQQYRSAFKPFFLSYQYLN